MRKKQFTRLEFSKLVTIDLAAKYVRRKNNELLSKMYLLDGEPSTGKMENRENTAVVEEPQPSTSCEIGRLV